MKKNILIIVFLLFWASPAFAQQATDAATQPEALEVPFGGNLQIGYRWLSLDDNSRAGEYEYLHSSVAGSLNAEWDPLPHRFMAESYYYNRKDFFGDLDYSFSDVVVFNFTSRGLFHNLDHYAFGPDDLITPSPSFTDRNPLDTYGTENRMNRAFIRFKTPDFPFHVYAEARTIEKEGTIQQRFLLGYFTTLNKFSESREIDWKTTEAKIGVNSHLGPVEVDYSHTEKRFEAKGEKVLLDSYPAVGARAADIYPHNLVPDLEASSDTIKIHTSYTGRLVAAATYSSGDKKNRDSGAQAQYWNAAGDVMYMPKTNLTFFLKYRHYDLDVDNPNTVTITGANPLNTYTYNVRDSISSQKDILTGAVRYRLTDRLALRGEYALESVQRDVGDNWEVAHRTTKGTAKVGATYRIMNKLTLRADYSHLEVDHPAYNFDPDKADTAHISATWNLGKKLTALLSYSGVREKRGELEAPLAGGSREAARDQALGSFTVLLGQRSSVTASYAYYRNKVNDTITYSDALGISSLESGVPYDDIAHVASLSLTHAYSDKVNFTAEASRSWSRGNFRIGGSSSVTNVSDIAELSDLKVLESIYSAGVEVRHTKTIGSELRYQYREYNDRIDNTQDGTVQIVLATMSVKW